MTQQQNLQRPATFMERRGSNNATKRFTKKKTANKLRKQLTTMITNEWKK
jgi:hypothetical protein